jgi:hypothetical protein
MFKESPAHFFAKWDGNPNRKPEETPRHFILGQALHHLLLGEPGFAKFFAIQPAEYENKKGEVKPWSNNATDCKEWHEARKAEGRKVLLASEVEDIRGMAESLGRHPIIKAGALNGQIERSIIWQDKETGIWLKSRPDTIPGDSADFVDLKSIFSVQYNDVVKRMGDSSYQMQAALGRRAAREVLGLRAITWSLVFVEKSTPYCVRVFTLKDNDLDRGEKQIQAAIHAFVRCLKSKHWPGPGGESRDAEYIELSEREQKAIDDKLAMMES